MSAASPGRSLLDRRLVIVSGKGGTGKTTVAASLACAARAAGRRVLVAEVGRDENVPRLFEPRARPAGYEGREVAPGIRAMRIDPFEALAEYLSLQIGARALVHAALRSKAFRQLMNAAPGWRELITMGKMWHLEQMEDDAGGSRYDLLVVDAPATGHGVTFLDVPRVVVSAIRAGPLRRHASWVEELIEDESRTLLLPVALAEELPASETAQLVERARSAVNIAVDRVVVNGVMARPFPEDLPDLDRRLAELPDDAELGALPPPRVLAACAAHLRARHDLNRRYVEEIGRRTGLPVVCLPYLRRGVNGREELETLAEALVDPPRAVAA